MNIISACHGAEVYVDDGEYICRKCEQPCAVEHLDAPTAEDVRYEKARARCRMPEVWD